MILTKKDLQAIGEMVDQRVGQKIEPLVQKLGTVEKKVDKVGGDVEIIVNLLNVKEIMENVSGSDLNLVHKIHKANQ